jgi:hypothetical protein
VICEYSSNSSHKKSPSRILAQLMDSRCGRIIRSHFHSNYSLFRCVICNGTLQEVKDIHGKNIDNKPDRRRIDENYKIKRNITVEDKVIPENGRNSKRSILQTTYTPLKQKRKTENDIRPGRDFDKWNYRRY